MKLFTQPRTFGLGKAKTALRSSITILEHRLLRFSIGLVASLAGGGSVLFVKCPLDIWSWQSQDGTSFILPILEHRLLQLMYCPLRRLDFPRKSSPAARYTASLKPFNSGSRDRNPNYTGTPTPTKSNYNGKTIQKCRNPNYTGTPTPTNQNNTTMCIHAVVILTILEHRLLPGEGARIDCHRDRRNPNYTGTPTPTQAAPLPLTSEKRRNPNYTGTPTPTLCCR